MHKICIKNKERTNTMNTLEMSNKNFSHLLKEAELEHLYVNIRLRGFRFQAKISAYKNGIFAHYLKEMVALGAKVHFFEFKDGKEKTILRYERHKRGKVMCNKVEYKTFEFFAYLSDFFKTIMVDIDFKAYQRFLRAQTAKSSIKPKQAEKVIETGLKDFETQENIVSMDEEFVIANHYDGKRRIYKTNFSIKRQKPYIYTHYEDVGVVQATYFKCQSGRSTERVRLKDLTGSSFEKSLSRFFNKKSPSLEMYYFSNKNTYTSHFFTIEYVNNTFVFSNTVARANRNEETTIFAEMTVDEFIEHTPFAYDTMASLFKLSKTDFIEYMRSKLFEMNHTEEAFCVENAELNNWLKEQQLNVTATSNVDSSSLEKMLYTVKQGISYIENELSLANFKKVNTINVMNDSRVYGLYHHFTSTLSFNIEMLDGEHGESFSTIFHEYGHLIHYSLMNRNLMGQKGIEHAEVIRNFLKQYKNCSYINKDELSASRLQYYRKDTELFARLFETYMMMKTNLYEKYMDKYPDATLNNKQEVETFVNFMNETFDFNFSLD